MKQYQTFIFDGIGFDETRRAIELYYSLDNEVDFTETIILPVNVPLRGIREPDVQRALRALHIIGGISYFKTCLPKEIKIMEGGLTQTQAEFWTTVYQSGLGEFFYKNKIDPKGVVNFPHGEQKAVDIQPSEKKKPKLLVPIGGGKDSLVTIELLKKGGYDMTLLRMGHHPYINDMALKAGLPLITVDRHLSDALFKLNADGALNGHVPITAYLSCLSVVIALLTDHTHVVMSSERSADEGNVKMDDMDVNHQWSKSVAFEKMFTDFIKTSVTADVSVFSLLRPLSELQIAKFLSSFERYLPLFTSCNKNWSIKKGVTHQGRWCCQCPKCAFAFLLFAAFLKPETLTQIFGKNLFEDASLLPLFGELLGIEGHKPFECVGTAREVSAAFLLAQETGAWDNTAAMKMFVKDALPHISDPKAVISESLTSAPMDSVPLVFRALLKDL